MSPANPKTQEYISSLLAKHPEFVKQMGEVIKIAMRVEEACEDLFELPATASNMAQIVINMALAGTIIQKAALAMELGENSQAYIEAAAALDTMLVGERVKMAKAVIDAVTAAKENDVHEGAALTVMFNQDYDLFDKVGSSSDITVWNLLLLTPFFFGS